MALTSHTSVLPSTSYQSFFTLDQKLDTVSRSDRKLYPYIIFFTNSIPVRQPLKLSKSIKQ